MQDFELELDWYIMGDVMSRLNLVKAPITVEIIDDTVNFISANPDMLVSVEPLSELIRMRKTPSEPQRFTIDFNKLNRDNMQDL